MHNSHGLPDCVTRIPSIREPFGVECAQSTVHLVPEPDHRLSAPNTVSAEAELHRVPT